MLLLNTLFNTVFRTCGTNNLNLNRVYTHAIENYLNKPTNGSGLFASPSCEDEWDTWTAWCRSESFNTDSLNKWVDFRLSPSAKVLLIQTKEDVQRLPWTSGKYFPEVNFDKMFNVYHYDAMFVNYSALCGEEDNLVDRFLSAYDCDTLFVRNLAKVDICHKRLYIYLKPEDWLRKCEAKKAHKAIWVKGFIDGNCEEVTFFFAHGCPNGALEFAPDHFTDHEHIAAYLERRADEGKYSQEFYARHARSPWFKETVITHGCFDGIRKPYESKNFRIKPATPFKGCTSTYVDGRRADGYLRIAICECNEND